MRAPAAPVIRLHGSSSVVVEAGAAYADPGAVATDEVDGSVSVVTSGTVDTATPGSYAVAFSATNSAGLKASATRAVTVVDTVDGCVPHPCSAHGACRDMVGAFECFCAGQWEGPTCQVYGCVDIDSDADGVRDCEDLCPLDALKLEPGVCGCGTSDVDTDGDGIVDCFDGCPHSPTKSEPGACGCDVADTDANRNGIPDCKDTTLCPTGWHLSGRRCLNVVQAQLRWRDVAHACQPGEAILAVDDLGVEQALSAFLNEVGGAKKAKRKRLECWVGSDDGRCRTINYKGQHTLRSCKSHKADAVVCSRGALGAVVGLDRALVPADRNPLLPAVCMCRSQVPAPS